MPDINLVCISPSQLDPVGDANGFDLNVFERRYLAQGDSWFSLGHIPFWATTNLLQQMTLSRGAVAVNCAKPGAELAHMTSTASDATFLGLLQGKMQRQWDALLVSGGGNDLIAAALTPPSADVDKRLLRPQAEWDAAVAAPARYLSEAGWTTFATYLEAVLDDLLALRDRGTNAGVPLVLHTYDYVTPRDAPAGPGMGPWLFKAFHDLYAIPDTDWRALSDALIDRLATLWQALLAARPHANVHLVDSRGAAERADDGTAGPDHDWENEIHPTPHGYTLMAARWRVVVDALP